MEITKKESKPLFRIDVKDYSTKKVKGFNVYGDYANINKDFGRFVNELKEKVEEI